jgi:hypothetical protein
MSAIAVAVAATGLVAGSSSAGERTCNPTFVALPGLFPWVVVADVAIDGDLAAVKMAGDEVAVLERVAGSWSQTATLAHEAGPDADFAFGWSILISGDAIAVGAPKRPIGAIEQVGAVYVFERDDAGWVESAMLEPPTVETGAYFGSALARSGTTMLVGASFEAGFCNPCVGEAHFFVKDGDSWAHAQTVHPSSGEGIGIGYFGNAVGLDGDHAVVAAFSDDGSVGNGGSVFAFERVGLTWVETQRIEASDLEENDNFGFSLALDGARLLVGSPEPCCPDRPGAAYVFEHDGSGWQETQILTAPDGEPYDWFGQSVALRGDAAVVGAPLHDSGAIGTNHGALYVFEREVDTAQWTSTGTAEGIIDPPLVVTQLGSHTAFDGASIITVGSQTAIYRLPCGPCPADATGDGTVDVDDLLAVVLDWLATGLFRHGGDIDGSGVVDADDLIAVITAWGRCDE